MITQEDKKWLQKAFAMAGEIDPHQTAPNPRVGCIIVKNNQILATSVHEKFGQNHAEKNAFEKLKKSEIQGSTIYVTLEPCDIFKGKKTPSCTQLLIRAKPKRMIIGDLDPQFMGKNLEKIKKSGIEVFLIASGKEKKSEEAQKIKSLAQNLNPFFLNFITQKKPFITLKIAQSLDGKITNKRQKKQNISNLLSRGSVMEMRAQYQAVLTTTQTILADNPRFNIRKMGAFNLELKNYSAPDLIILGKQKIPPNFNIFSIEGREILFFQTLEDFLQSPRYQSLDSILTECGGLMNAQLIQKKIIDQIEIFIAPQIIGNLNATEVSSFDPCFLRTLDFLENFRLIKTERLGEDVKLIYQKEFKK